MTSKTEIKIRVLLPLGCDASFIIEPMHAENVSLHAKSNTPLPDRSYFDTYFVVP